MTLSLQISADQASALSQAVAPLYRRYPGQTAPQPAFLELDVRDGRLTWGYSGEIGNARPADVAHGLRRRYSLPAQVSGKALQRLIGDEEVLALLRRVLAGATKVWDGHNHVCQLDADAEAADDALSALLEQSLDESDCAAVWDVETWLFASCGLMDHFEDGQPFDAAIANLRASADVEGVLLEGDIEETILARAADMLTSNALHDVPVAVLCELAARDRLPVTADLPYWLELKGGSLSGSDRDVAVAAAEAVLAERGISALAAHIAHRAKAAGLPCRSADAEAWDAASEAALAMARSALGKGSDDGVALAYS